MAQAKSTNRVGQPDTLLVRIGNLRELLDVYGEGFHLAINDAVLERLLACGVAPSAIALGCESILVDLSAFARPIPESAQQLDDLCYRVGAIIACEPVVCEQGRAYLQVLTEVNYSSEFGVLPGDCADGGVMTAQQRRSRARRLDMLAASALLDELRAGNLVLAFQPIHLLGEVGDENCLYSEALLRRSSPSNGRVYSWPNAIEALERAGWITRLDCSVIWTVVRLLERYPAQRIGCNVSAASFRDGAWWNSLMSHLELNRQVSQRLTFEITETSAIADSEEALALIAGLRSCGARVALDDMGAGHSTLEFLSSVRPDVVKIDRSILLRSRELQHSPDLLRNLVKVCADYTPCVVVEGVESKLELQTARYAGVKAVQGYLIERPNIQPSWLQGQNQVVVTDAYADLGMAVQKSFYQATPRSYEILNAFSDNRVVEVLGASQAEIVSAFIPSTEERTHSDCKHVGGQVEEGEWRK